MRAINKLVIHCSASHQNVDVDDIRKWHVEERKWSDIGYHYVITSDGDVQEGRPMYKAGAHVAGHNHDSIGICWVGGYKGVDNRTDAQKLAMRELVMRLIVEFDIEPNNVLGHCDFEGVTKTCPNFDVQNWFFNE